MTSTQYEELCRRYVAATFNVPLSSVVSRDEPHPRRPGDGPLDHQIDLWWETGDANVEYVHIANAKWRGPKDKVDQPDVLLLEQVRSAVNAHKAVMLTNTDFTAGARSTADAYRIALHIVRPEFDTSTLPMGSGAAARAQVVTALDAVTSADRTKLLYSSSVVHRGFVPEHPVDAPPPAVPLVVAPTVQPPATRVATGYATRVIGGGGSGAGGGGNRGGSGGGFGRGGGGFRR